MQQASTIVLCILVNFLIAHELNLLISMNQMIPGGE